METQKPNQLNKNKQGDQMSILSRSLLTGLIGGMLWSLLGFLGYYFNFIEVAPRAFLIRSWIIADWTSSWLGHVVSFFLAGVVSLLPAFIYYCLFKKISSLWAAVLFGLVLWGVVFYVLNPVFPNINPLSRMNKYSIVSTLCLYSLYGAFVGYSISYDYKDTLEQHAKRENNFQHMTNNE